MKKLIVNILLAGLVVLVLGIAVYRWRHPDSAERFEYAFGIAPPPGVVNIEAYRRYLGGPGDRLVLLRFSADRAAIDRIVAVRPLERDLHVVRDRFRPNDDVEALWRSVFGPYADYGGIAWEAPSRLVSPEVYEWRGPHPKLTLVKLLWDTHTGRAFALYTIG
jgi:hypothetical protein